MARRVAIDWLTELLARDRTVAFVPNVGVWCAATSLRRGDVMPTYRMADGEGQEVVRRTLHDGSTSGSYGSVQALGKQARSCRAPPGREEFFMTDVNITPSEVGPYLVAGPVHLTDVDGRESHIPTKWRSAVVVTRATSRSATDACDHPLRRDIEELIAEPVAL